MLEFYKDDTDMLKKFYILEDCMSAIGDKAEVDKMYADLQKKYKFNIVRSTEFKL